VPRPYARFGVFTPRSSFFGLLAVLLAPARGVWCRLWFPGGSAPWRTFFGWSPCPPFTPPSALGLVGAPYPPFFAAPLAQPPPEPNTSPHKNASAIWVPGLRSLPSLPPLGCLLLCAWRLVFGFVFRLVFPESPFPSSYPQVSLDPPPPFVFVRGGEAVRRPRLPRWPSPYRSGPPLAAFYALPAAPPPKLAPSGAIHDRSVFGTPLLLCVPAAPCYLLL